MEPVNADSNFCSSNKFSSSSDTHFTYKCMDVVVVMEKHCMDGSCTRMHGWFMVTDACMWGEVAAHHICLIDVLSTFDLLSQFIAKGVPQGKAAMSKETDHGFNVLQVAWVHDKVTSRVAARTLQNP